MASGRTRDALASGALPDSTATQTRSFTRSCLLHPVHVLAIACRPCAPAANTPEKRVPGHWSAPGAWKLASMTTPVHGATFDSSIARGKPSTFAPRQVIKAWTEAMQMMTVGSKWELVCPPEIAYGSRAKGERIPANSVLIFTMEMLDCQGVASEL